MTIRPLLSSVLVLGVSLTGLSLAEAQPRAALQSLGAARAQSAPLDRVLAVVNADVITERELQQRTRSIEARLRAQNVSLPPGVNVQREVLDRMITERALLQVAKQAGVRVEEGLVDRALNRIAADQGLSLAQWRQRLLDEGQSLDQIREEIRQEIVLARLREREVDARVQVSEAEVTAELAQQAQAAARAADYHIQQWLVSVPDGATAAQLRAAQAQAQELAQQARAGADFERLAEPGPLPGGGALRYTAGELRPAERLPALWVTAVEGLAPGDIAPVVQSAAGFHVLKLLAREGQRAAPAEVPIEQTRVAHILVRVDALNPESEVVRRLKEIRERIEAKAVSFAEMARQYSADGSAGQGGDLGWLDQGDTVPEFERAMDALEPGQIAGPVRSPFGYHLIQVTARRTQLASPEGRRAQARKQVRERKIAMAYQEFLDQVRDRAYVEVRLDD